MISLSERAAEQVRELLAEEADAETLRVAVQGGGCSGFQYALGFDGAPQAGDDIAEQHGVTVIVDRFSLPYLEGASVDFVDGLMGQGFTVENPNASARAAAARASRPRVARCPRAPAAAAPAAVTDLGASTYGPLLASGR